MSSLYLSFRNTISGEKVIYEFDTSSLKVQLPRPEVDSTIMPCQLSQPVLVKWYNLCYHIIGNGNSTAALVTYNFITPCQPLNLSLYSV